MRRDTSTLMQIYMMFPMSKEFDKTAYDYDEDEDYYEDGYEDEEDEEDDY
jgi:hypothetical protein